MIALGAAFVLVPAAMWPSVPLVVEEKRVGTAFGLMTAIQNLGLGLFPLLNGKLRDVTGTYTATQIMFACLGVAGLIFALLLLRSDRRGMATEFGSKSKSALSEKATRSFLRTCQRSESRCRAAVSCRRPQAPARHDRFFRFPGREFVRPTIDRCPNEIPKAPAAPPEVGPFLRRCTDSRWDVAQADRRESQWSRKACRSLHGSEQSISLFRSCHRWSSIGRPVKPAMHSSCSQAVLAPTGAPATEQGRKSRQ
jgi:hypothetical protein